MQSLISWMTSHTCKRRVSFKQVHLRWRSTFIDHRLFICEPAPSLLFTWNPILLNMRRNRRPDVRVTRHMVRWRATVYNYEWQHSNGRPMASMDTRQWAAPQRCRITTTEHSIGRCNNIHCQVEITERTNNITLLGPDSMNRGGQHSLYAHQYNHRAVRNQYLFVFSKASANKRRQVLSVTRWRHTARIAVIRENIRHPYKATHF